MKVQIILLHDANSSDPVQVIGVLPELEGADHFQRMERALKYWEADEQEQENEAAAEEGREPEVITRERLFAQGTMIDTQVLPITEGF